MRASAPATAILVLLSAAVAAAEDAPLDVVVARGTLRVATDATIEGAPLALYAMHAAASEGFVLRAPRATVVVEETRYAQVLYSGVIVERTTRAWNLTNVAVGLSPNPRTDFHIYSFLPADLATLDLKALGEAKLDAIQSSQDVPPEDNTVAYGRSIEGLYMRAKAPFSARLEGNGSFFFQGFDVRLAADQNTTTQETTWDGPDAPAGTAYSRTLRLHVASSEASFADGEELVVAARSFRVAAPRVTLTPIGGSLDVDGDRAGRRGAPVDLDVLPPFEVTPRERGVSVLRFEQGAPLAEPPVAPGAVKQGVAGAVGVFALLVGAALLWRRRAPHDSRRLGALADRAAERGRFASALWWTKLALRRAPRRADLHLDQGYFLERLGRADAALEAYERAGRLKRDGRAPLSTARLLVQTGADAGRVEAALRRAVDENPWLADEILEDPAFAEALRKDDLVEHALGRLVSAHALAQPAGGAP